MSSNNVCSKCVLQIEVKEAQSQDKGQQMGMGRGAPFMGRGKNS